jgi:hypothetical protein
VSRSVRAAGGALALEAGRELKTKPLPRPVLTDSEAADRETRSPWPGGGTFRSPGTETGTGKRLPAAARLRNVTSESSPCPRHGPRPRRAKSAESGGPSPDRDPGRGGRRSLLNRPGPGPRHSLLLVVYVTNHGICRFLKYKVKRVELANSSSPKFHISGLTILAMIHSNYIARGGRSTGSAASATDSD